MTQPSSLGHAIPEAPHPAPNPMLICDNAIGEEGTDKVCLIGIFEEIGSPSFPFVLLGLSVYTKVTDARGDYDLALELVRL